MAIFRPVKGSQEEILALEYNEGFLYFATDTKKIFLDAEGQRKIPMGGNSGIYYGTKTIPEDTSADQIEFTFYSYEIEGNEDSERLNLPDVNDLILNKDGCFYRVISIEGEKENSVFSTWRLTLAGSGGTGGGPSYVGEFSLKNTTPKTESILFGHDYNIGFIATATDGDGAVTGSGTYEIQLAGRKVGSGVALNSEETVIPVGDLLDAGLNKFNIIVRMDIGGEGLVSRSIKYEITATSMELTWDYSETDINYLTNDLVLNYQVTGNNITKSAYVLIDNLYQVEMRTEFTTSNSQSFTIAPDALEAFGIGHGAHTFEMWATANSLIDIEGNHPETPHIIKQIMFVDIQNTSPIISFNLTSSYLTQYETAFIPIIIYSSENISNNAVVILQEDGEELDKWENVANQQINTWAYTPTKEGAHQLTVWCGSSSVTKVVEVKKLEIDNEEIANYAFKLKASDFASNNAIQNWNSNGINATFNNFDWINGGLQSEKDEKGNNRQFIKIKAGSSITINYSLFNSCQQLATTKGKAFKMIFKATNCRDYDANILSCKFDKKDIKVDFDTQYYLRISQGDTVEYSTSININDGTLENIQSIIFDKDSSACREALEGTYMTEDGINYQCHFMGEKVKDENDKEIIIYSVYWNKADIVDSFEGLVINAQSAGLNTNNNTLSTQFCEDTYIELEFDISKVDNNSIKNYITFWIDGVPSSFVIYGSTEEFINLLNKNITIGSNDCDIQLYLIKVYERGLTDDEHIENFIADAMNGSEMLARYNRNNILDDERPGEISYTKLATQNPDCLVHLYQIPRMTKTKKDKVYPCSYSQYHGSDTAVLTAENVVIKVQGTSSEKYVLAAANIDSDFYDTDKGATGFYDVKNDKYLGETGWSMDGGTAIPVNFTCTKVNVASCENANNALNQEWYNLFQPYQTVLRCKNPRARDTMQFTNGVIFMKDTNGKFDTNASDKKDNNLFGETSGYLSSPYYKFYSLANMGNSKDNIHVFHDTENPLECCIEVNDNQMPQQWMVEYADEKGDNNVIANIDIGNKYYGFRYPDGVEEVDKLSTGGQMKQAWADFVQWMAESNPQPKYKKHTVNSEQEFKNISKNWQTQKILPVYIMNEEKTAYSLIDSYDSSINTYYTETEHKYGYTNLKLPDSVTKRVFGPYTFKGYKADAEIQKDYNPLIEGCIETTYANNGQGDSPYDYDTYEYRMAKMLSECEEHLVMDSVVYHYLFIERHCMVDNVAKNTFWSTEDCQHWNLTKDYDNDTADGNDNNGKFTRTYGMEPLDELNAVAHVFNAYQSVWLNFIHGLSDTKEQMYEKLEQNKKIVNGKTLTIWSASDYLEMFKEWQSRIPERCWIADYRRKYFRPYELYGESMFLGMMEGGQKTHQRKQYETYQGIYMSSEYLGADCMSSNINMRPEGEGFLNYPVPTKTYSDCYIHAESGGQWSHKRVKRNAWEAFYMPADNFTNATLNFFPANVISVLGSNEIEINGRSGLLNALNSPTFTIANAQKMREVVFATKDDEISNTQIKDGLSFMANPLLEKLYVANITKYEKPLNLSNCPNLLELDASNSAFTEITIADKAPVEKILLHNPTSLTFSNLANLKELNIKEFVVGNRVLGTLILDNIDNEYISTKHLVDSATGLKVYSLKNVKWNINSSSEINASGIDILDRLLALTPFGNEVTASALTGNLTISANAYNDNDSINIYNKYAQKDIYPNLDIEFLGESAKLYNITILNGDGLKVWNRKIIQNGQIDNEFLSAGPSGAFSLDMIYKMDTDKESFNFNNKWLVYLNNDLESIPIELDSELPLYNELITSNITLIPQFTSEVRKFNINFFGADLENPILSLSQVEYGQKLSDIQPNEIPYKEYNETNLYGAYDFNGYSLIPNSSNTVANNYEIKNNQNFYAYFVYEEDIRTKIHYDWFDFDSSSSYDESENGKKWISGGILQGDETPKIILKNQGWTLRPKNTLQGKVTIPKYYQGKPVWGIQQNAFLNNSNITHIFQEKEDKQLLWIGSNAFNGCNNLKYFDFGIIREIESLAFQRCSSLELSNFNLSEDLRRIGSSAFNGAITSNNSPGTIYIPSKVAKIDEFAFNFLNNSQNCNLQIGNSQESSRLNLSLTTVSSAPGSRRFVMFATSYAYKIVDFYTNLYSGADEIITVGNELFKVADAFYDGGTSAPEILNFIKF